MKGVSVIIPGYNEEHAVSNTVSVVHKIMSSLGRPFEIFVVDDGSADSTPEILKKLAKKYKNLRYKSYSDGPSRRENLAKSFKLLKGEDILLLDMDLSLNPRHFAEMLYWLDGGFDMVIINRYHKNSNIKRHPKRFVISKVYNAFIRLLFHTGFKDNICGFKAFKRNVILNLVGQAGIDNSRKRSVFWDTQILIHAVRSKLRIKEIPATWTEGKSSALSFKKEMSMFPYILKFWWRLR
ncbi:glycosyltransferase [Candidatus Woesearchaeota archaeon]|nr:glycosyltransferase [Candidatus Woesearchaeota archaeon]